MPMTIPEIAIPFGAFSSTDNTKDNGEDRKWDIHKGKE